MKIFAVLEYNVYETRQEPFLHGVFSKRRYAEGKAEKLVSRHKRKGYIAVIEKRILGL